MRSSAKCNGADKHGHYINGAPPPLAGSGVLYNVPAYLMFLSRFNIKCKKEAEIWAQVCDLANRSQISRVI